MNKIKRVLAGLICTSMLTFLVACAQKENKATNFAAGEKKKTIVTSFYPMYIFTKNITKGINDVKVHNMTSPQTGCLHDYQLTTGDMKTLESADVLVINGAGMESFMDKVKKQTSKLKIVEASTGIEFIKNKHENHKNEHANEAVNEDEELEVNPHVWVGISGAIQEVKNISQQLEVIDTKNAESYKKNSQEYIEKLEGLKIKMTNALKDVKNRDIITFHEAFPYFAKEFNLNVVGVIEKEPGEEPTAKEVEQIIKTIKDRKVKALFTEEQYSPKAAVLIAKETGAKVYRLDLAVTGPKDADIDSYTKAMEKNLQLLLEALDN